MSEAVQKTMTIGKALKVLAGVLGSIVAILVAINQLNGMIDSRINKNLDDRFDERVQEKQAEIGFDAIEKFKQISVFVDSLKSVYPELILLVKDEGYVVVGLYVDPATKDMYYVDRKGITRKVYKGKEGKLFYFDSELRIIE